MRRATGVALAAGLLLSGACASGSDAATNSVADTVSPAPTASAATTAPAKKRVGQHRARGDVAAAPVATTPPPAPASAARPDFRWHSSKVTARSLGDSWHRGCPVGPSGLRKLSLTYWGFDRTAHEGRLVVAAGHVSSYVSAFRRMYSKRFPVRRMRPVSAYGGSDNKSMRHDNTSAFNCRYAVSNGPKHWSMHAYGSAVDINPRENPYRLDGEVMPPEGKPYMDRSDVRRGMIVEGSVPVHAFDALGWGWGGRWSDSPDYQHFSSSGG